MEKIPELTKEEYIRFELTKALLTAKPRDGATSVGGEVITLTEVVLTGHRPGEKNPCEKP